MINWVCSSEQFLYFIFDILFKIMPVTKSAKKALKVSRRRFGENLLMKYEIKNRLKGLRLVIANNQSDTSKELSLAYSALDKAAKKKFIHKNKASRLKSRLSLAVKKASLTVADTAQNPKSKVKKIAKPATKKSSKSKNKSKK